MNRTIVSLPGDGIGKTVLPEAIRVLDAAGFEAEYIHGDIGWEFWCKEGNALPQRTIELLEKYKIGLFGAITSMKMAVIVAKMMFLFIFFIIICRSTIYYFRLNVKGILLTKE